jgi:digeranylgeranylglycerophospholipid reductase
LKRYDFLVVGGGPVGCRTARTLAILGHQVAVLEKNHSVGGPVCCTGIVSQECRQRFQIPSELILKELNSASVYSPGGKVFRLQREETQAVVLNRGPFNAYMARQAQEAGVDYLLGHSVVEIRSNPDGIVARAETAGKEEYFQARAVVLACGFGSRLPQQLGFNETGKWVVGAQAVVEAPQLEEVEVYLGRTTVPGYFAWLAPAGDGTALAGLMTRENADGRLAAFLSDLEKRGKISGVQGKACFRGITVRPSRSFARGVLLAGDVAGQVKPLTGGGIYFGLLCADLAAETLHAAFEASDFSTSQLSGYQKQWKFLLGRELRLGGWAQRLYAKISDERLDKMFARAERRNLSRLVASSEEIRFDRHGSAMLKIARSFIWPPS